MYELRVLLLGLDPLPEPLDGFAAKRDRAGIERSESGGGHAEHPGDLVELLSDSIAGAIGGALAHGLQASLAPLRRAARRG